MTPTPRPYDPDEHSPPQREPDDEPPDDDDEPPDDDDEPNWPEPDYDEAAGRAPVTRAQVVTVPMVLHHPLVPKDVPIYGYLYDVRTGRLAEIASASEAGRAIRSVASRRIPRVGSGAHAVQPPSRRR